MKFNGAGITAGYDRARALPLDTLELWSDEMRRAVPDGLPDPRIIADVGCGTGRFCSLLAETFDASVIGLDPSDEMLLQATPDRRTRLKQGQAERIPLEAGSVGMVFMSMVAHHFEEPAAAAAEAARVLSPKGVLLIRNATAETMYSDHMFKFFPEARAVEQSRLPSRAFLQSLFGSAGFRLHALQEVRQIFAQNLAEYADKMALRAVSALRLLPDPTFEAGMARLRQAVADAPRNEPIRDCVDLLCFVRA